jgi:arylsulfatase A-like enzyme
MLKKPFTMQIATAGQYSRRLSPARHCHAVLSASNIILQIASRISSHWKRKLVNRANWGLAFLFLALLSCPSARSQQPNIIYIMTDDMGYGDLGSYGQKKYTTPNLDKLAAEGVRFENAYSAGPLCTPTRTAYMTGRYPARTPIGLIEPLTASKKDNGFGLTAEFPSIATLMKNAGYQTVLIGKWHLGSEARHRPRVNGFDYFFGFFSGAADYISHKGDGRVHDLYENETPVYPEGYLTELISQKASGFLKQKHSKPFFLTVNFNAPHWPWQVPGDTPYADTVDYRKGGSPETYAAMMISLDSAVGNILKTLDEQSLSAGTIVIFTNDNGGERYSDQGGLAEGKGTLWEGGIKVPAIVRWPGRIRPGSITKQAAITMDWSATILAMGNAKAHPDFPMDGINLAPILAGDKNIVERTFYWRTYQRTRQKAIREGEWKYLQDEKGEYLFNLEKDPGEKNDRKNEEKAIFERLKEKFSTWEKTVLLPIPL